MGDGIYSGFYKPPITSAEFRISIRLDGYRRPVANTLNEKKDERSLPIDQSNYKNYQSVGLVIMNLKLFSTLPLCTCR